jgi:hypothetical protein
MNGTPIYCNLKFVVNLTTKVLNRKTTEKTYLPLVVSAHDKFTNSAAVVYTEIVND